MHKAYASYFVSYLLSNFKDIENIKKIILFGSVARNEASKDSDIDLFVEIKKQSKKFSEELQKTIEDFYKSREALIFKTKGIDNKINIITGNIDNWKDLKKSIESTGILLYGKYLPSKVEGLKYSIIAWDNIKLNRGAFLNKLYGFKVNNKHYSGLIEQFNGKKLGKSSIMIPIEHTEDIFKLIKHYKVNARIIEVYY